MMGIASFLVWQKGWESGGVKTALALFAIQLILNGLWSVLFFGMRIAGSGLCRDPRLVGLHRRDDWFFSGG